MAAKVVAGVMAHPKIMTGIIALAMYLMPTAIAAGRRHHRLKDIVLWNVLLGWTLFVWWMALAYASVSSARPKESGLPPVANPRGK